MVAPAFPLFRPCTVLLLLGAASFARAQAPAGGVRERAAQRRIELALDLDRLAGPAPSPFAVTARARFRGRPVPGLNLLAAAQGGVTMPFTDLGTGEYVATVFPSAPSGEVVFEARLAGTALRVRSTALVLPRLDAAWGQAERVPGLVNTAGWEDSAEVSPDGEWLLVGTYSPVDLLCCLFGCSGAPADPDGPDCNVSLGPVLAPGRPALLGGGRVLSPTVILDEAPSLGLFAPLPFALPPVAAYGFRLQPDGSFAAPFVLGFEMDGFTYAPFGFSFAGSPAGSAAELVFAFSDPRTATGNDLYWAPVTLGAPVSLGTYRYSPAGGITAEGFVPVALGLATAVGNQGNPHDDGQRLWFDTEGQAEVDVRVASHGGALPGGSLAPSVRAAVSLPGRVERQPYFDGGRLYFGTDAGIRSAAFLGGAPEDPAAWGPEVEELAAEAGAQRPGAVVGLGEPSLARRGGETWLYFVYVVRTAAGFDANVARVRRR